MAQKKVSLDHVAVLLGDNPETVREHYFKWVAELQQVLDDEVKKTWATEPTISMNWPHSRGGPTTTLSTARAYALN